MTKCEECNARAWWEFTGKELPAGKFLACNRHLAAMLKDYEYEEGEEFIVRRIYFPGA